VLVASPCVRACGEEVPVDVDERTYLGGADDFMTVRHLTIRGSTHSPHRPASTSAKPQPRMVPGPSAAAPTCTSPWPQPEPPPAGRACPRSVPPSGWPAVSADYL